MKFFLLLVFSTYSLGAPLKKLGLSTSYGQLGNMSSGYSDMGVWKVNAGLGFVAGETIFISGSISYLQANQFSSGTYMGNRRGYWFNPFTPSLGFYFDPVLLQIAYDFLGSYKLENLDSNNRKIEYARPSGIEFSLGYQITEDLYLSFLSSLIEFKKEKVGTTSISMGSPMRLMTYGLNLEYIF